MKFKFNYGVMLSGALLLSACGGGGLINNDSDVDTIVPDTGSIDESAIPHPPADSAVITNNGPSLLKDSLGNPLFLRGINLAYGANPVTRIDGITAIKDTDANVVRLQITRDTTNTDFEGAMARVVDEGLVAVVTLVDDKLTCVDDSAALLSAVDDLWLTKWIEVLVQDRFQSHIMLNIASGWGPANIFYAGSLGYQDYLDTYKALIRKIRKVGFKFPLVIDAPGCGADYNAFLAGRAQELQAADTESNIVLGVHVDGVKWNSNDKLINAFTSLQNTTVPFIVDEFGGSGVGENPIDHLDLMKEAAGDAALALNIAWASNSDSAAYAMSLPSVMDLRGGAAIAASLYVDRPYLEYTSIGGGKFDPVGKTQIILYVTDTDGNSLKIGMAQAQELRENTWNKIRYSFPQYAVDPVNLMNGATSFKLNSVAKIGMAIMANGKPVAVKGNIKLDDLMLYPGVLPTYEAKFDADTEGWTAPWDTGSTITQANGSLSILPAGDQTVVAMPASAPNAANIDWTKSLQVRMRIFLPAEYASDTDLYFQLFGQMGASWEWTNTAAKKIGDLVPGGWADVVFNVNFKDSVSDASVAQNFGLQIGNLSAGKTQPILIDSIVVSDPNARPTTTVTASQYKATFSDGTEGFAADWGGTANVSQADGALAVTFSAGDSGLINKSSINSIQEVDLSGDVTIKFKIFIPEDYVTDGMWMQFAIQDGKWSSTISLPVDASKLVPGEWVEYEYNLTDADFPADFARTLLPNVFGLQYGGVSAGTIKIDDVEILGNTKVDNTQPVLTEDFSSEDQATAFAFDFAGGSQTESSLASAKYWGYKVIPFGWMASTWIGSDSALDISTSEDMVQLTPRGDDIVNGAGGISETTVPAGFE